MKWSEWQPLVDKGGHRERGWGGFGKHVREATLRLQLGLQLSFFCCDSDAGHEFSTVLLILHGSEVRSDPR